MKILLQRVNSAAVAVDGETIGQIERGLLLMVGFGQGDDSKTLKTMMEKVINMRVFPDQKGRFDLSLLDIEGEVLLIPQFTLYADTRKGRRPEFFSAMAPEQATEMFDELVKMFEATGLKKVQGGAFGAYMKVSLENDGPVTIMLDSKS